MRKNKPEEPSQKALEYAFLLLKFRLRSQQEIIQRLQKKKFSEPIIKATVDFLKEKNFVNDVEFARQWISSRISRNLGLRRLKSELKLKGVPEGIIAAQIGNITPYYSEPKIIEGIVKKKLESLKGLKPEVARRRIWNYLIRRGFSPDIASDVLNNFR